ncbi:hypothetical protein MCAMS1_01649 [biofilm metagenome]
MKKLPNDVKPYRCTPEFTETTIPKGLLQNHMTKPGVWAVIHVLNGTLEYLILEPVEERHTLMPGHPGIVEPVMKHHVRPLGPVRFYVEFQTASGDAADPHA